LIGGTGNQIMTVIVIKNFTVTIEAVSKVTVNGPVVVDKGFVAGCNEMIFGFFVLVIATNGQKPTFDFAPKPHLLGQGIKPSIEVPTANALIKNSSISQCTQEQQSVNSSLTTQTDVCMRNFFYV
jgi:hypothetical protein